MATQIVIDHTGDKHRHSFEISDPKALSDAAKRFELLTGLGFTAAVRSSSGEVALEADVRSDGGRDRLLPAAGQQLRDAPCILLFEGLREKFKRERKTMREWLRGILRRRR